MIVKALRVALTLCEVVSRMKVNFHKSMLAGINIDESWLIEAASIFLCKIGRIPFLNMGLPIGGDARRVIFWEPVTTHIKARLFD